MPRCVLGFVALVVGGCGDPTECMAPSHIEYTCPSPPADAGCPGGPVCINPQADPDMHFSVGCQATLPQCGLYEVPIVCTCTSPASAASPPSWVCREGVEPAGCGRC